VFRNVLENHPFWNSTDLAILPGPTDPPPACLIAIPLGAAVITPDANNGASLTAGGHIDLLQFRTALRHVGWTNHPLEGAWPSCWRWRHLCRFGGLLHTSSRIGPKSGKECGQLMERIGGGRCNLSELDWRRLAGGVATAASWIAVNDAIGLSLGGTDLR
jgi:hypothetical protein